MQAASANTVVNTAQNGRCGELLVITEPPELGGLLTARSIELYSRSCKKILIVGNMRKGLRLCYIAVREPQGARGRSGSAKAFRELRKTTQMRMRTSGA